MFALAASSSFSIIGPTKSEAQTGAKTTFSAGADLPTSGNNFGTLILCVGLFRAGRLVVELFSFLWLFVLLFGSLVISRFRFLFLFASLDWLLDVGVSD